MSDVALNMSLATAVDAPRNRPSLGGATTPLKYVPEKFPEMPDEGLYLFGSLGIQCSCISPTRPNIEACRVRFYVHLNQLQYLYTLY